MDEIQRSEEWKAVVIDVAIRAMANRCGGDATLKEQAKNAVARGRVVADALLERGVIS